VLATEPDKIEEFRKRIIEWYGLHGDIRLPWRSARSGWEVLVASFLLRKTATKQVAKIYVEFIRRYPGPQALLKASEEEVRELIKPLGIEHQRSKHLIALARELVGRFGGRVPCDKESLKELPGVGDYIASEVLLVACNQPEPLLDRNMIRVLERVFGVKSLKKRPHTDKALWHFAKTIVPAEPGQARKFNYGVLDFARKICISRSPKCPACPLREICFFYAAGRPNP
jgi:A/G-specific adenine glycosylase